MNRTLRAALRLSQQLGWAVLPLQPGEKRPCGRIAPRGVHSATTDPETIRQWWRREPNAGLGVATGTRSNLLVVLDADTRDAVAHLRSLGLPRTAEARTRRGHHWLFRSPTPIPSSSGRLGPKIDVQSDGRYVAIDPTEANGYRYLWRRSPLFGLAELPGDLVELLKRPVEQGQVERAGRRDGLGGEKAHRLGGVDRSRSGQDGLLLVRLVRRGFTREAALEIFRVESGKFQQRWASRGEDAAVRYFDHTLRWAVEFAARGSRRRLVVTEAHLETWTARHGRPPYARVRLTLADLDGGQIRTFDLAVPDGTERSSEMWFVVAPHVAPEAVWRPEGAQMVKTLQGVVFTAILVNDAIVWLEC